MMRYEFKWCAALVLIAAFFGGVFTVGARAETAGTDFGLYLSLYEADRGANLHTSKSAWLETYKKSDFAAILKQAKAMGFTNIYVLPGLRFATGSTPTHKHSLPFLHDNPEWKALGRDPIEEILSNADKLGLKVYYSGLNPWISAEAARRDFPQRHFYDANNNFTHDFNGLADYFLLPAVDDFLKFYRHHKSLVGFGSDEISYEKGNYSDDEPSMSLWGPTLAKKVPRLDDLLTTREGFQALNAREAELTEYHRKFAQLLSPQGYDYTTTVNNFFLMKTHRRKLAGGASIYGADAYDIMRIAEPHETAVDFYRAKLASHCLNDVVKLFHSPSLQARGKTPANIVIGTLTEDTVLVRELLLSFAEGVDRVTLWSDHYLFGDHIWYEWPSRREGAADLDYLTQVIRGAKKFSALAPMQRDYDVAVISDKNWTRSHYRDNDVNMNEGVALNDVVDQLNAGGFSYDIMFSEEAQADRLKDYRVAIVPLGIGIASETVAQLELFVKNGGKLLVFGDVNTRYAWDEVRPANLQTLPAWIKGPTAKEVRLDNRRKPNDNGYLLKSVSIGTGTLLYSLRPIHQYREMVIPKMLELLGVQSTSPLAGDNDYTAMGSRYYDSYWGPTNLEPLSGKFYDVYWNGPRSMGFGLGYRGVDNPRPYVVGDVTLQLRPYDIVLAGRSVAGGPYDLYLTTSKEVPQLTTAQKNKKVYIYNYQDDTFVSPDAFNGSKGRGVLFKVQ